MDVSERRSARSYTCISQSSSPVALIQSRAISPYYRRDTVVTARQTDVPFTYMYPSIFEPTDAFYGSRRWSDRPG